MIYSAVIILVYESVELCDQKTELILAPLSVKKQLWEAGDAMFVEGKNRERMWDSG